jgi:hypothetical protein
MTIGLAYPMGGRFRLFGRRQLHARDVATRPGKFRRKTDANEIRRNADNRNRGGQRMREDQREVPRHQHVDSERKKLRNELPRSRRVSLRVALLQDKVAAEDVSTFLKPLAQARNAHVRVRKPGPVIANARNFLLRARRRRPRAAVGNAAGLRRGGVGVRRRYGLKDGGG